MPRSSEAFSSSTRERKLSGLFAEYISITRWEKYSGTDPNSWRDRARIVDVFPVPGGP